MTATIVILLLVAVIANATMDEIKNKWYRLFAYLFPATGKLQQWFNPAVSWRNKYLFKDAFLNFIVGSVFVSLTDFWHLLKAILLACVFSVFLILAFPGTTLLPFLAGLLICSLVWGTAFELINGVFGALSDIFQYKKS